MANIVPTSETNPTVNCNANIRTDATHCSQPGPPRSISVDRLFILTRSPCHGDASEPKKAVPHRKTELRPTLGSFRVRRGCGYFHHHRLYHGRCRLLYFFQRPAPAGSVWLQLELICSY